MQFRLHQNDKSLWIGLNRKFSFCAFSRKFLTKIYKNSGNFRENFRESFRENAKSVIFTTYFNILITFLSIILFWNAKFSKQYSIWCPIPQEFHINNDSAISMNFRIFAKISRKCEKSNFRFGPNGNWILALPHLCLFILLKWDVMANKLHHMYHACRITVIFNGFFSRNFAKIVPFSHDFRIFAKIEKCIFVSTLSVRLQLRFFYQHSDMHLHLLSLFLRVRSERVQVSCN
jgi:hypothetical protein